MHHHDHAPHPHLQHCIDTCAACAQICDRCADDMIGMEGGEDRELRELCIRLCRDCADLLRIVRPLDEPAFAFDRVAVSNLRRYLRSVRERV